MAREEAGARTAAVTTAAAAVARVRAAAARAEVATVAGRGAAVMVISPRSTWSMCPGRPLPIRDMFYLLPRILEVHRV